MRTYVDDNIYLKWCPAPNCEYAVECKVHQDQLKELVPAVTCRCGHTFCFGCSLPNHQPCICYIVKFWIKKCEDDSETANWISANTKECIKCSTTIEKAGGCNHMTCRKCKHEVSSLDSSLICPHAYMFIIATNRMCILFSFAGYVWGHGQNTEHLGTPAIALKKRVELMLGMHKLVQELHWNAIFM